MHVCGCVHKVERRREARRRSLDGGRVEREPVGHVVATGGEEASVEVVSVV